eukprot:TRINITY_DN17005_c0_g1_i1.p1 TRINITY_DN17005_c0_g1~~TRINITY_DN17005_c0_g1_i1.p1  ORF type:complete len:198 (+),score=37.37 TRINITY_DN17005_c0_g1_i1:172-765(+)
MLARSVGKIQLNKTAFFLCDIQERFRPHIQAFPAVVQVAKTMTAAAKELQLPLIITEQYPEGLGKTVSELDTAYGKVYAKKTFSMVSDQILEDIKDADSVVLFGIEAHVCILQTAFDLIENGKSVHLVVDGTSSMRQFDRITAFQRMRDAGVFITTCESILFQLVRSADHPNFKAISNLMKQHNALKLDPELPLSSL